MHEVALVHEAAASLLASAGATPITGVVVAVGPRVDRPVAEQAWLEATRATPAGGASVTWVAALDTLCCLACGRDYQGAQPDVCPSCGGDGLVVDPAAEVAVLAWSVGSA